MRELKTKVMNMSRYEEGVTGVWKHAMIGANGKEVFHEIVPDETDNIEFVRVKNRASRARDDMILTEGVGKLFFKMITRTAEKNNPFSEEDKNKLKVLISLNAGRLTTDLLVKFNWTTQQKLDEMEAKQNKIAEEVQTKKLMEGLESPQEKTLSKKSS